MHGGERRTADDTWMFGRTEPGVPTVVCVVHGWCGEGSKRTVLLIRKTTSNEWCGEGLVGGRGGGESRKKIELNSCSEKMRASVRVHTMTMMLLLPVRPRQPAAVCGKGGPYPGAVVGHGVCVCACVCVVCMHGMGRTTRYEAAEGSAG